MKLKKVVLFISIFALISIPNLVKANTTFMYYEYNPLYVKISNVMKWAPIICTVIYIIFFLIYCTKSKSDKKIKFIKLLVLFFVMLTIAIGLYLGADKVLNIGKTTVWTLPYDDSGGVVYW